LTATIERVITFIVISLLGSFALAGQSEAKVFIDPKKTAVDGSLEVKLTLRSKAGNAPECRVVIDLGDGNLKRLRVGPGVGNKPLKVVDHQYEKAGAYEIRLMAPRQRARRLPFFGNKMKIEASVLLGDRDEEVEVHGEPDCWDSVRGRCRVAGGRDLQEAWHQ